MRTRSAPLLHGRGAFTLVRAAEISKASRPSKDAARRRPQGGCAVRTGYQEPGCHLEKVATNGNMTTAAARTVSPQTATAPRSQALRRWHSRQARSVTAT